jgi:hypothetical protein
MPAQVTYADPEPNGLATMIGGLIEANLSTHPARDALLSKRSTYAIRAPDAGVSVTVTVAPGAVTLRNGLAGKTDLVIETDSENLIGLSAVPLRFGLPDVMTREGREVNRKLFKGELKVTGLWKHPAKLARLNKLLTVL